MVRATAVISVTYQQEIGKTGNQENRKSGKQEIRKTGKQEIRKTGNQETSCMYVLSLGAPLFLSMYTCILYA